MVQIETVIKFDFPKDLIDIKACYSEDEISKEHFETVYGHWRRIRATRVFMRQYWRRYEQNDTDEIGAIFRSRELRKMTLRKKKADEQIAAQVFQSSVKSLELSWDVVRREKKKLQALTLERQLRQSSANRLKKLPTSLGDQMTTPPRLINFLNFYDMQRGKKPKTQLRIPLTNSSDDPVSQPDSLPTADKTL